MSSPVITHHDGFSEKHVVSLLGNRNDIKINGKPGFRLGMHSIWTAEGLIGLTLATSNIAIHIQLHGPFTKTNRCFQKIIETEDVPLVGFHPERVALYLELKYGYRMQSFYEMNPAQPSRLSIPQYYQKKLLGVQEMPSFNEINFINEADWLNIASYADVTDHHLEEAQVMATMLYHIGQLVLPHEKLMKMGWDRINEFGDTAIRFCQKMMRDANATIRNSRPGVDIDFDTMEMDVLPQSFVVDSPLILSRSKNHRIRTLSVSRRPGLWKCESK